jgi:hypothetical protein
METRPDIRTAADGERNDPLDGSAGEILRAGRQQGGGRETKTEDAGAATADP